MKEGISFLKLMLFVLIIGYLAPKGARGDFINLFVSFSIVFLVLLSPGIFLHILYFIYNYKTVLTIDNDEKRLSITKRGESFFYSFDDILYVERHLGTYHKGFNRHGPGITPWTGYGYLKLKLKDGQTFFLSSLMLDVMKPPLQVPKTKFRFIPYFDKVEVSAEERRKWAEQEQQEKINNYLETFADLPIEVLQEKVDDAKRYEPEAVAAAKKILEQKSI